MSYCTFATVQDDFKTIAFTSTSLVKDSAVTQFIVEADALINSYVGQRWVTPITANADSLALMSLFSRTLVAARIRGIMANVQVTNKDANQTVKSDAFGVKDVMQQLNNIKNGDQQLAGATLLLANGGFYSNNYANNVQPEMNKNRKLW